MSSLSVQGHLSPGIVLLQGRPEANFKKQNCVEPEPAPMLLISVSLNACSQNPACTCRRPSFKDIMAQLKLMTPNSDADSSDT